MRKKVVVYFHKRPLDKDPFATFQGKRSVYHSLFKEGIKLGFDMFVANGVDNYISPLTFLNCYKYNGEFFEEYGSVIADAIYDRSGGLSFPSKQIRAKTLNSIEFKQLCNDKNATYELLKNYMPKNLKIVDQESLYSGVRELRNSPLVVLKPAKGMQGNGVIIDTPDNIGQIVLTKKQEYSLQEFVDTSMGISGITDEHHDLRIVIVDGDIVLSHLRTPKKGSLLANVAQGGSIKEVPIQDLPKFILDSVNKVQEIIEERFDYPLYSIDFGIQNQNTPFIFEINDQIGFPSETMDYHLFIKKLLNSLDKRTTKQLQQNF